MDLSDIRNYCLSLPHATEDTPFGEDILIYRVYNKIFACIDINNPDMFVAKCDPDYAIELRDAHPEIEGAYHWNKKYWNQVGNLANQRSEFVKSLIRHSYAQVVKKLTKAQKNEFPEILEIC